MARDKLRSEIRTITDKYSQEHERLQVKATRSLDELTVVFKRDQDDDINLTCTISEEYPHVRPLWFSAEDDEIDPVCQALADLNSDEVVDENNLEKMVNYLLTRLCDAFSEENPEGEINGAGDAPGPSSDLMDEDDEEEDIDGILGADEAADDTEEGLSQDKLQKLESIRQKSQPSQRSSPAATDRLMKDLKSIYKSDSYKKELYTVKLPDDNVYEWRVALLKLDNESKLAKDMVEYKVEQIELSINFASDYPFRPPFVRVISPVIQKGYVLSGGAICLELLTEEGWSSAYSMESVIMQIGASLVKGDGRIQPNKRPEDVYTLSKAKNSYRTLVHIHKTSGWYTPPKADG